MTQENAIEKKILYPPLPPPASLHIIFLEFFLNYHGLLSEGGIFSSPLYIVIRSVLHILLTGVIN